MLDTQNFLEIQNIFEKFGGKVCDDGKGSATVFFDFGQGIEGEIHIPHKNSLDLFVYNLSRFLNDLLLQDDSLMHFEGFQSEKAARTFTRLLAKTIPDILNAFDAIGYSVGAMAETKRRQRNYHQHEDYGFDHSPLENLFNDFDDLDLIERKKTKNRNRKDNRNNFFYKEKYNPNNTHRRLQYINDADFAIAHIASLIDENGIIGDGEYENRQCRLIALWTKNDVAEIYVENKVNNGNSVVRLRKYKRGWDEDFSSFRSYSESFRPVYYKHYSKNTSGMKRFANKHVRHSRIFMKDTDENSVWEEEVAPRAHGWYRRKFESYDICDY